MAGAGGLSQLRATSAPRPLQRRGLAASLVIVLLLHLLLLNDWRRPTASLPAARPVGSTAVRVSLRELDARVTPPAQATTSKAHAVTANQADTSPAISPTPAGMTAEASDKATEPDLYLPRSALTQGASPIGWVELPYPDTAPPGHYRAELTLFIDASGVVQRVRVEQGALPGVLQDAARQAFLQARFQPGEIDGQPVRSRMRIEVEFGADPPPGTSHGLP